MGLWGCRGPIDLTSLHPHVPVLGVAGEGESSAGWARQGAASDALTGVVGVGLALPFEDCPSGETRADLLDGLGHGGFERAQ
jgi:hypothetical protein